MSLLKLTLACASYDRVLPIIDGRIRIEGCDTTFFPIDAEEAFARAFRSQDFDITELSFSSHILATSRGKTHYQALPVFISRYFRHSAIYIRTDRGINSPKDLRGKLVGVPEYQMTAALWVRGLFSDEYGVPTDEIRWRNGGLNNPGRTERIAIELPQRIELKSIPDDKTLSGMLQAGELDAIVTARAPKCFTDGGPNIDRLFPDFRRAEEDYYRKTSLFPIMHVIAVRRSLLEENPWLGPSVYKAFLRAKNMALADMQDLGALSATLPWLLDDVARVRNVMGHDFWPYGVPANRKAIDAMLRWSVEQGLSEQPVAIEDVFAPGMLQPVQLKD